MKWSGRTSLDVRYAIRLWAKTPAFTLMALLTLGVGIGASTAIVAQVNAVFWRQLPVAQPEALRLIVWSSPRPSFVATPNVFAGPRVDGVDTFASFTYSVYVAMRDNARGFSDLACWLDLGESRPVVLGDDLGFAVVQFVSGNFFRTLGVPAHVGRTIQPDDDGQATWTPVAMVSYRFWQRVFGGDSQVVRRTLTMNGRQFAIVGVIPEHFTGLDPAVSPDVVVPVGAVQIAAASVNPLSIERFWNHCRVVGRRAAHVSEQEATHDLEQWVAATIAARPPGAPYDPPRIVLLDGSRGLGTLRDASLTPLVVLLSVVGGLLLATCANLAGLLLARGAAREREITVRLAVGATRSRIIRQMLTETLVLSVAGGTLGVILAYWATGSASWLLSQFMPTLFGQDRVLSADGALDIRVLSIAGVVSVVVGLVFGVLPALRASQLDLVGALRQAHTGQRRRGWLSATQAMVYVEAALAMALLIGAGLFLRTMASLREADRGIDLERVIYARIEPRAGGVPAERRSQFFEEAVKRLQSLPGVTSASAGSMLPLGGTTEVGMRPRAPVCTGGSDDAAPAMAAVNNVLPGYFSVLGIHVVTGREFLWSDNQPTARHVIVNESFAVRYLTSRAGDEVVRIGANCRHQLAEFRVVGIVTDVVDPRVPPEPMIYFPLRDFGGTVTLVVRTAQEPAPLLPTVRRAMRDWNAKVPIFSEATLVDLRERQLRQERLLTLLLMGFGVTTLLVCCIGIYGMLSYLVARRRGEISVRMAIGAPARDIVVMVVRESLLPVAAGMLTGVLLTFASGRALSGVLFGVAAVDSWAVVAAASVFLLVAGVAAALPARAAARIDPVLALRQ